LTQDNKWTQEHLLN